MTVFGISFSVLDVLLLIIISAAIFFCATLLLRLHQKDSILKIIRRDNSKLRNEVANITGWEADGRLPENWVDILHNRQSDTSTIEKNEGRECDAPFFLVAYRALKSVRPPYYASNDDPDSVDYANHKLLELLENATNGEVELEAALVNGEFDRLFCLWRRLETYFYDKPETYSYGIAANAVLSALKDQSIDLIVPQPLMMTSRKNRILTNNDSENLRQISRIREKAQTVVPLLNVLQANEEIVVDCQRPGVLGPNAHVSPRLLILDKSW